MGIRGWGSGSGGWTKSSSLVVGHAERSWLYLLKIELILRNPGIGVVIEMSIDSDSENDADTDREESQNSPPVPFYFFPSACFTLAAVIGSWKRRAPVASNIAFAMPVKMILTFLRKEFYCTGESYPRF